jgi:hypothetical protein
VRSRRSKVLAIIWSLVAAAVTGAYARSHWHEDQFTLKHSGSTLWIQSSQGFFNLSLWKKLEQAEGVGWHTEWFSRPQPTQSYSEIRTIVVATDSTIWFGHFSVGNGTIELDMPYYVVLNFIIMLPIAWMAKRRSRLRIVHGLAAMSAMLFIWAAVTRIQCSVPHDLFYTGPWQIIRIPRTAGFLCGGGLDGLEIEAYVEIYAPVDQKSRQYAQWEQRVCSGNFNRAFIGFYAQRSAFYLAFPDGHEQATFAGYDHRYVIPYWAIMTICAFAPAQVARNFARQWRRARIAKAGFCPRCGYDLRATPSRCPECGVVPTPQS